MTCTDMPIIVSREREACKIRKGSDGKDDDDTNWGNENVWDQSLKWNNFRILWQIFH